MPWLFSSKTTAASRPRTHNFAQTMNGIFQGLQEKTSRLENTFQGTAKTKTEFLMM